MKENIKLTTLDNGVRVVTDKVQGVRSAAVGIWVGAGARYEDYKREGGIAHLTEHMLFKGTNTRSVLDIAGSVEAFGGNMNAYTGREITAYTIHGLSEDVPQAVDVLSDIVRNSTIPEDELKLERGVVLQEINMCADTPDDLVFDHLYNKAFESQPIGAPILGKADCVAGIKRQEILDYISRSYRPDNIVLSAAGAVEHDAIVDMAKGALGDMKKCANSVIPKGALYTGGDKREQKDLEQAHIVMGFCGVSRHDDDFWSVKVLSAILGGGMSSRLFQEVREKRGLAYSIYSFHSAFSDAGLFGIYAGTGGESVEKLIPIICDEVCKVTNTINEAELSRAKSQIRASILMSREDTMSRADSCASSLILRNRVLDIEDICNKISAVTKSDIERVASKIFATNPTIAALGAISRLEDYDAITRRLA